VSPTPAPDDAIAVKLAGVLGSQFELRGLLGRGASGSVYLARETFLERDVAVKVLTAEVQDQETRARFLREARTAARLSHPHIVPLYTFGEADGLLYYVMGHVDGTSLEARLQTQKRIPSDEVRRIMTELADALEYAHAAGVVHRDLKPDNVLLDRATGRVMLTDFGIAKSWAGLDSLTKTGVAVGTPHYMSPEQAAGEREIDGRSDIYSLGILAYRMATGRLPFEGTTFREVLVQHATREPVAPSQVVDGMAPDVDAAIRKALAKDPSNRWRSARELRRALTHDGDDSVPDDLFGMDGFGVRAGLAAAGLGELGYLGTVTGYFPTGASVAIGIATALVGGLGLLGVFASARKAGWSRTLRWAFAQPRWWSSWWPRWARRSGDRWDRLPTEVRHFRVANGLSVALSPVFLNVMVAVMVWSARNADLGLSDMMVNVTLALAAAFGVRVFVVERRLSRVGREAGLTRAEIARLKEEPTWTSFWTQPQIGALLGDSSMGRVGTRSREPADLLREINQIARDGSASPHAEVYRDAVASAQAIVDAIFRHDRELAAMARDVDDQERKRIEASMSALGDAAGTDGTAKSRMRELLQRQLDLLAEIDGRREAVEAHRMHLHEQLRTLALLLVRLRTSDLDDAASSQITEGIRTLAKEIEVRAAAADEVRDLLT
jgi:tRNA A-37 threonylcarbamoyl transferase component Bud32